MREAGGGGHPSTVFDGGRQKFETKLTICIRQGLLDSVLEMPNSGLNTDKYHALKLAFLNRAEANDDEEAAALAR